ncbi:MAG: hypothetical protein IT199_05465, partial [Solirubrobacterales bacterium]|nr:hypothetical protein [Solirubrobacterales bacterium]
TGPTGPTSPTGPTGPTDPDPVQPKVSLRVTPANLKLRPAGRATLSAWVTVAEAAAPQVKVCVAASRKARGAIRLPACRTVQDVAAGRTVQMPLAIRASRQARGRFSLRTVVSVFGFSSVSSTNTIKVTK